MKQTKLMQINRNDNRTLKLIGVTRSSSKDIADGFGPAIQKSELEQDAKRQQYELLAIRDIVEPATIELEERELFNSVFVEAVMLKKQGKCDGLDFGRCDRMSRRFDAALQIALDCKKNGLTLRFVRENQWLMPDDEPIALVMLVLQAFGVHTQTGISIANMNAGRIRAAAEGKLPSGVGQYGMIGYKLVGKKFETDSSIGVAEEILQKALKGLSINQIMRDLQSRGVHSRFGGLITRASVYSVLKHARRYAGIWDWYGYEIKLMPPIITLDQAHQILDNLKRNKERSLGFGKRKWLTSRVTCGVCGRRFVLRTTQGCSCSRSNPEIAMPPCPNVKVSWKRLGNLVWEMFVNCITSIDALEVAVKDRRQAWKAKKADLDKQVQSLKDQLSKLEKKRRLYSWQHVEGIIDEQELLLSHKKLKSEEIILNEQLARLEEFGKEQPPPSAGTFKKLADYWSGEVAREMWKATDEEKDKFAELFDLRATVLPDSSKSGYHVDLTANIPLETEGKKPAYEMVFSPLGEGWGEGEIKATPHLNPLPQGERRSHG